MRLAGGNLDVLAPQPEHRRRTRRRCLGEVQADGGLNHLRPSARDEMDLDDEIGPGARRQASPSGRSGATCPGVQPRK